MAPTPPVSADGAADAAQGASSGFLKWAEDNKGIIFGAAVGASAAGLGYYFWSNRSSPGAPPSDSDENEKNASKKRRSKKKSKSTRGGADAPTDSDDLKQDASDEDILKLSAEEIAQLPKDTASNTCRKSLAAQLKTAGNRAYKDNQLDKAIRLYTKAIAAEPQAVFYCNRAACYTNQHKYREVIEDTNEALELEPTYIKAINRRAVAAEKLGGDGGSGKLDDEKIKFLISSAEDFTAVAILSKFADVNSTSSVEKVLDKLARARTAEVLRTREPKLPSPTFVKAYFEAFRKRPAPALPESPSEGDEVLSNANKAVEAKQYVEAYDLFKKSLELGLSSDNLTAYALNMRATFKFIIGDAPGAVADLEESTRVKPDYVQSWVKMASAHMELADREHAFADFDKAIEADANDPDIYYHRGQVHFILQEFEEALSDYAKSTELDDTFIFSQVQHAVGQYKLGRVAESSESFSKILAKFSSSSEAYNYYGELQLDQQKFERALTNFDKAIEIEATKPPKERNVLPMINKALLVFQWKSDLKGAETLCRQALEIDEECDVAVATLAQLCLQQGKLPESISWFERSSLIARTEPELINALTYEHATRAQVAFINNYPDHGANLAALATQI